MLRKIMIAIGLIALLPTISIAGEVNVKKLNTANWIYFETARFRVLTDAKEEIAFDLARELENFMCFLSFFLGYEQKALPEEVHVVAAKNRGSFKSLGMPDNLAGLFLERDGYIIFANCERFSSSSKGMGSLGRSFILNELVHLFLHNASSELALPLWYDIGMSRYFSTYMEKKGKVIIGDMSVLRDQFVTMLAGVGGFISVDTESLFKMSRKDLDYLDTRRSNEIFVSRFYARATLVVHYMLSDTKRNEDLNHYLSLLKKGSSIDESFKNAFKMTFSELDNKVNHYIEGKNIKIRSYRFGEDGLNCPDVEYRKHDIAKRGALGLLYTNICILPDDILTDANFDKLNNDMEKLHPGLIDDTLKNQFAEHPENPLAMLRLARTYKRLNKYAEAIDMYERAFFLKEPDATTLNHYAWFLVTMPDKEFRNPKRAIELAEKAVAMERSPSYLDTLAEAYYVNGSIQKAIETINEAISLNPRNIAYYKDQLKKFKEAEEKL
ncbi:MAG: tetratricopeptide repeat protein [Deltaproteobacteria bacterium]|nr:tetratricopeptide repeat protein [Deltaproteobacteria bacterium]